MFKINSVMKVKGLENNDTENRIKWKKRKRQNAASFNEMEYTQYVWIRFSSRILEMNWKNSNIQSSNLFYTAHLYTEIPIRDTRV